MNAEPAGGGSVNHATESTAANAAPENRIPESGNRREEHGNPKPKLDEASTSRVMAILGEEGFSEEEALEQVQPRDQQHAETNQGEQTSGQENEDRRPGSGEGPEGQAKPESGDRKAESKGEEDEPPLDPKEHGSNPLYPRVSKLTWQRDHKWKPEIERLQRENTELKERAQGAPVAQATAPTADDPLADVDSPEKMEKAINQLEDLLVWARENPEGVLDHPIGTDAKGNVVTRDFSAKEMAAIAARTDRTLRQQVPRKIQLLRQQHLHEQVARQEMPALFEEGTEENRFLKSAQREIPGIMNIPGAINYIRWAWAGRKAELEAAGKTGERIPETGKEEGKNGKAKVDPKIAPFLQEHREIAPGVPAARVAADERGGKARVDVQQAQERVELGDGEDAEVDLVTAVREEQAQKGGRVLV